MGFREEIDKLFGQMRQVAGNTAQTVQRNVTGNLPTYQQARSNISNLGNAAKTVFSSLQTPQGTDNLRRTMTQNVQGTPFKPLNTIAQIGLRPVQQLTQMPYYANLAKTGFNPKIKQAPLQRLGNIGLGALGTAAGITPFDDPLLMAYDFYKGANLAENRGKGFKTNLQSGIKSLSMEKPVGLGESLSTNPILQAVGNVAELPAMFMVPGMVGSSKKKQLERSMKILNNEDAIKRLIFTKGLETRLSSVNKQFPGKQYGEYISKLRTTINDLFPGFLKQKDVRALEVSDPQKWSKLVVARLEDALASAREVRKGNYDWNFGLSTKAQKRLEEKPVAQSTLSDIETPKTVKVWNKSKFSNDGAYADIPVIRKEDNITLYQGSKPGENRQFWTSDKKYAEQFGDIKEKTGSFYKVDNGNRVTDVYVEAPKAQSTIGDINPLVQEAKKYKSADEFVRETMNKSNIGLQGQLQEIPLNKISGTDYPDLDQALRSGKKLSVNQAEDIISATDDYVPGKKVTAPIEVRKNSDGSYSLMAGNHRLAQKLINGEQTVYANIANIPKSTKSQLTEIWNQSQLPSPQSTLSDIKPEGMKLYTGQVKNWTPKLPTHGESDSLMYGKGIYLTPDEKIAKQYAGDTGMVHNVVADIKNPLTPKMKDWQQFIQKGNAEMKYNYLVNHGYDAVVDTTGKYKQVMVVDPKQISQLPSPQSMVGEIKTGTVPQTQLGQGTSIGKAELSRTTMEPQTSKAQLKSNLPIQTGNETTLQTSSTDILPQKGRLNVQRLNLPEENQALVRSANNVQPTVIGNKEVVEASKLTNGSGSVMTDAQQKRVLAQRLNSRQTVVSLTKQFEQMKKSGASEGELLKKFNEIADQSLVAQQERTFAGRLLQSGNILADEMATPQQKILALLDNAGVKKEKYNKDAIKIDWNNAKQVVDFYRKHVPPKFGDILTEFRYTNMLSSPLTHIVNTATNLGQAGIVAPIEKTVTGALDWVKHTMTGSERQYYASDGISYAKGFYKSFPEAWTKFKNILSGKELSIKPDMERIPLSTKGALHAYTTPLRALEAADQFFMNLVKNGEAASMQNRGLSVGQIENAAEKAAKYRLFRQAFDPEGKTGQGYLLQTWDKYNNVINKMRKLPGGNWIVPFLQTPTNILKQGLEYSPAGLATLPGSKRPLEQLSKTIIGSTVLAGAYGLLNSTEFTWDVPKGNKERDLFYAANMQPYSIKIGDKWVSYSKLGPLSYPIAMAAALRYAEKNNLTSDKSNVIGTALGGMLKFFSDQSYVKQLGDMIDSLQTGKGIVEGAKMEVSNAISQLVPYKAFLGWMSRIIDPISRQSSGPIESVISQLPGLSTTLEPYYNPVTKQPSERTNRFANAISPVRFSTGNKSVENMYNYTGSGKRAYASIMELPVGERAAMFNKIKQSSPGIAREVVKIIKQEKLGVTSQDKKLLNLSASDGERAFTISREFKKLKTPKEKAALWNDYVKKGIITKDVAKQLNILLKQ